MPSSCKKSRSCPAVMDRSGPRSHRASAKCHSVRNWRRLFANGVLSPCLMPGASNCWTTSDLTKFWSCCPVAFLASFPKVKSYVDWNDPGIFLNSVWHLIWHSILHIFDVNSHIYSDIYSDIFSNIYSGILSDMFAGVLSDYYLTNMCQPICLHFVSHPTWQFYLAFYLTVYLA